MSVAPLEALAELPPLLCPHTTGTATPLRDAADARRAALAVNRSREGGRRPVHPARCLCGAWTTTTDARAARASRRRRR